MKQVDKMRELYRRFNGDPDLCIQAYARAEEEGEVVRKSNVHNVSALDYANNLFHDGKRKGWIEDQE